jgi:hypothetical protein
MEELSPYLKEILDYLKTNGHVYTMLTYVSRSGMSRSIKLLYVRDNTIYQVPGKLIENLGYKYDKKNGGHKIGGCGMDMGFALVYDFCRHYYSDGYKLSHHWL